ncbi:protein Daple isoform X1 [Ixodes scapularis]|uniref:protein Daple isoform X1 n=1 Tax=Ixodes scapularis TaxID=6945 RepID=UPI001A9D069D|nr:protein Daple isoform X1 [Ixodes scapularis]
MNAAVSKMKIPDFSGPSYKRKPWIPPPALTSKEDREEISKTGRVTKKPLQAPHRPLSPEYPRGTAIPLHPYDSAWLTDGVAAPSTSSSGSSQPFISRFAHPDRAKDRAESARELRDSSTWTENRNRATETQTDINHKDSKMEQLQHEVAGLRGALEVEKLTHVVAHFEVECQDFEKSLQEKELMMKQSRQSLSAMLAHLDALKATLSIAKNSTETALEAKHHRDVQHRTSFLKEKAAELRGVISAIRDNGDDSALNFASGTVPRIWEQLVKVLSRMEEDRLTSSHEDLVRHLHQSLKDKEEHMVQLERDLAYYKKREEQEKERQDRCLDTIEEMQRKHREDRDALKKSSKAFSRKVAKYEESLQSISLVLNQKEKELGQLTRERDDMRAMVERMTLDKADMERALATVKRKLVDLEPLILNPTGDAEVKLLKLELSRCKSEMERLRQRASTPHSADLCAISRQLQMLKNELKKSKDPSSRQLVGAAEKLERDIWNLNPVEGDPLYRQPKERPQEKERIPSHVATEGRDHVHSALYRRPGDDDDKEKLQLIAENQELREKLNREIASNRNLSSYITTLRRSYAAVFRESPESSARHSLYEDDDPNVTSPHGS